MTTPVYEFPREWYSFLKITFQLRSGSQTSPRPWAGGSSIYGPHVQLWMPKLTVAQIVGDGWQARSAFFSRLGGQAGLLRMSDPARVAPQYNTSLAASVATWSDGSRFTDGSGFLSGLLPPTAFLVSAKSRGDRDLVVGGLPASIVNALRPGDLLEVRPNGIASLTPHLYEVSVQGDTNAAGQTGVEVRPPLRANLAAGDMVVLSYPTSVFHLIDDSQGEIELSAPFLANFGFSLIEAIENA
jgi:hypothetical protein